MPQLDIDILEDFLFFAFAALLLGLGEDETEENVVETHAEAHLAQYYITTQKSLRAEVTLLANAPRLLSFAFSQSLFLLLLFYNSLRG
jgi:hypothetical protein